MSHDSHAIPNVNSSFGLKLSDLENPNLSRSKPRLLLSFDNDKINSIQSPTQDMKSSTIQKPMSPIDSDLLERIINDQLMNSQQKYKESKLREELQLQQLTYENRILESEKQLEERQHDLSRTLDIALTENNKRWEALLREKNVLIESITERLRLCQENHKQEIDSLEKNYQSQLKKIEETKTNEFKTQLEYKEHIIKEMYDKKLKQYEKQIIDAEQAYSQKSTSVELALRKLQLDHQSFKQDTEIKEKSLKEELALKDIRLVSQANLLDEFNMVKKSLNEWQKISGELSALCIRTCVKANELPDISRLNLPNWQNQSNYNLGANSFSQTNNSLAARGSSINFLDLEFLNEYNQCQRKSVTIERKSLVKLLKFSKVSDK